MAVTALFARLLAAEADTADVVIGAVLGGRTRPELAAVAGCFANVVALPLSVSRQAGFRELLLHVREVTLSAYAHQEAPFVQVLDLFPGASVPGRPPLVQVLCALDDGADLDLPVPGLRLSTEHLFARRSSVDLSLTVVPHGKPRCVWEYRSEIFDRATIRRLHGEFENLLLTVAEPGGSLSSCPTAGR